MHLSKLELFGFKSFANKTVVNFTKGITGIVGPNGCGKTNIVDAMRWCLGEQKSSTLRSDKMENVIFNGTRTKKPMGMSEVSLTIVNDRGLLPTDFSEVTITRRIFRSGESEYLLNKNICRLKDITNLFMDTGMGTNAYSVIELKMIETILSNKAEERRRMFEEAAGVNKYKLRRRLSLNKLDDVKKDLTRVNDIVSEVEKTVRSLERQAKKADRYNTIQTELREKEIDLAEREFFLFSKQLENLGNENIILSERKESIDKNIKEIELLLMNYRQEISNIESDYRIKSQKINEQNEKLHSINRTISVSEERSKSLFDNINRFEINIKDFKNEKEEVENSVKNLGENLQSLENELTSKSEKLDENRVKLDERKEQLNLKRSEYKNLNADYNSRKEEINSLQNELRNHTKSIENNNSAISRLNDDIQKLTSDIAKSVGFLEDLENEKEQIQIKLKESEEKYSRNAEIKQALDDEISELKLKELEERNSIINIKDKIDFFQNLINNYEGVSQGSKSLLESEGWTENEKLLLADIGSPKESYRVAVETALKNILNNIILESTDDLKNALEYLKKNQLGKAAFLVNGLNNNKSFLERINDFSARRKRKKIENESGFIDWATNLIDADNKWKPYFNSNLRNIVIVDNYQNALQLRQKYREFDYVTAEGDYFSNTGIVEAGSEESMQDSIFGRRKLLDDLKNQYPRLEMNLKDLREVIENKEDEVAKINLGIISDQGKILLNEINNIEKQISQFEFEKEKSGKDIERIQESIQENLNYITSSEKEISKLTRILDEKQKELDEVKVRSDQFEKDLEDEENEYNNLLNFYNNLKVELERTKGEVQNKNSLLSKSHESISSLITNIDKLRSEIDNAHQERNSISANIQDNQSFYDELMGEKNVAQDEIQKIEELLNVKKSESSEFEHKLNNIRNQRQEVSDNIHEIKVRENEVKLRFENLVQHIKDEYNISLEFKHFDDLDNYNFDEMRIQVSSLREKLKNLGPINLLAYSEFEEENERLEFLNQQRNDLIESEKELVKTIKEINESAELVFMETFENIQSNFKKIFQTLFNPGDEADLVLEQGVDPLEAKIEIVAKPKGKRPTSIELLSGGEKTLTATALLFAIYLVKPSPFCIMDEVDAPLDDANVDRFTKLLKEFSSNTQFIIVTHNKRTMEAAENMYGVTIQEEGISKLVGVQFNEQIGMTA